MNKKYYWSLVAVCFWLGTAVAQAQLGPVSIVLSNNWEGLSGTFTTNFANWPSTPSFFSDDTVHMPLAATPVPLIHVARFNGAVGSSLSPVSIPVANAGISNMVWSVTVSDPTWISATPGPTVAPESTGALTVNVSTTGKTNGVYWGSVSIASGTNAATVGVRLQLQ